MDKPLSDPRLQGFLEVIKAGTLTAASRALGITQPALSLRLSQLEGEIGAKLFTRTRKGMTLTEAGTRFLRYAQARHALDQEFLGEAGAGQLSGLLRIAGHFSIVQHVAVPALAELVRTNPKLQLQTMIVEDDKVVDLLQRGDCDFAFLQRPLQNSDYRSHLLGAESYVLIESKRYKCRKDVFLDSDPTDTITDDFMRAQKASRRIESYSRSFLHNETGILRAVALGLGRAVVARNEIANEGGIKIVPGYAALKIPSYLHYPETRHRSPLQVAAVDAVLRRCGKLLDRE